MILRKYYYSIISNYIFIVLLILITGCNFFKKNHTTSNATIIKKADSIEFIDVDNMLLNSKINFKGTLNELSENYKTPDSINNYGYECGSALNESNRIYFYDNTEIEISNSKYFFRKINFKSEKIELNINEIKFNNNYSIENFSKDFPLSFKKNNISNNNNVNIEILIASSKSSDNDIYWRLYFSKNKLVQLDYFIPC